MYVMRCLCCWVYNIYSFILSQGPPGQPTKLKVLHISDSTVSLQWYTGYDYGGWQVFHVMERRGNESVEISQFNVEPVTGGFQWVTKQVTGLASDTGYNVSVVATGPLGKGQVSEEIYFRTTGMIMVMFIILYYWYIVYIVNTKVIAFLQFTRYIEWNYELLVWPQQNWKESL